MSVSEAESSNSTLSVSQSHMTPHPLLLQRPALQTYLAQSPQHFPASAALTTVPIYVYRIAPLSRNSSMAE
jgi:hypothetical protein